MADREKLWVVQPGAPEEFKQSNPQLESAVADLLFQRGLVVQPQIDEFLHPDYGQDQHDPFLFKQMVAAVERVQVAISRDELITIHGDYDADGLSGAVILFSVLKRLGAKQVNVYLPDREREGYGLNANTVSYLHGQGTKLIITCDCGISNAPEVDAARALGMDVIITDHHAQKTELPNAILLHPKVRGETYPFKDLAGGGVAFKFAQGLLRAAAQAAGPAAAPAMAKENEAFEKWLLDMVAVSSVADMVPLIGENRTLVKYGLTVLSKARRVGMKAILTQAGLWPPKQGKELNLGTYEIGFIIAPRLNAAGRMDHANAAFAALMAEDELQANQLAEKLENTNRERQVLTEQTVKEAVAQLGEVKPGVGRVLVAYNPEWSIGVAGLIASRLLEKFHLPVFVLAQINGQIAGSGRSPDGFDCTLALGATKELYAKYGGHKNACGFTLVSNDKLDDFRQQMDEFAARTMSAEDLIPKLKIDGELSLERITWDLHEQLSLFEPHGMGNQQPKFVSRGVEVKEVSTVGKEAAHLKLVLTADNKMYRKAIAFRFGHWAAKLKSGDKIDVVYYVEVNEWNGNRELQLKIVDLKPCT
ncbi:MAG: single-stranded-DNA-specific exonuclease RecJ [Parcubacteria group bacterium]|nr:single-stranded-DNA-specific exonuclease RecJ [Parcubacteria group bacterium]